MDEPQAPARPARRSWLLALGLYAALTVALTWPLALRLRIMDPGDSAYFAWVMAWERHALLHDPLGLPHANVYHPARYVLGMDEPVLGTTLLSLPLWPFTDDAVLVYSLVRLATYLLSALFTWRLARELHCGDAPALLAGALFAFSPIRTDQVAHLSTLGTQWLPLAALGLVRFARSGARAPALLAALFYALAFYACGYHGLLGLPAWAACAAVLLGGRPSLWLRALPALVLALALLWPLYGLHAAAAAPHGFVRDAAETARFSSGLQSFLAVSPWNRVYGTLLARFRGPGNGLFPGLLPLLLVAAAALQTWRERRRPARVSWAFAALALCGALTALGPEIQLGGQALVTSPVAWLREILPPLGRIRAYGRAGVFVALGLALLAARAARMLRLRPASVVLLGALGLLEGLVVPIPLAEWARVIDSGRAPPPVYAWLARQPPGQALVELPLLGPESLTRRPAQHESIYMVRSSLHWQRLVNGYLGVEPRTYVELREVLQGFPSAAALQALRAARVRYALVHRAGYGPNQWARLEPALAGAELRLVADFGDDRVYELGP